MDELPAWCEPLPDAGQMREIDRWAIEQREVPSLELMERAGEGVAAAVERLRPDGEVAVLCGKGNNGGDGLVAARLLRQRGRSVSVISIAGEQELHGDALENLRRLRGERPLGLTPAASSGRSGDGAVEAGDGAVEAGAALQRIEPAAGDALQRAEVVVDALLGTGFAGAPHGAVAEAIELLGSLSAPVVSVDVPSGVDASTGAIEGTAVRAALTVTFHAAKPGLWIRPGKAHAGEVEVLDIGIPRGAPRRADAGLIGVSVLRQLPPRDAEATKFSSGHVLVVGGSRGLTGAPRMSAEGAMRAGAGYVTACVPGSLQPVLATGGRPEMMTRPLAERDGALAVEALQQVLEAAGRGGALVLGTGLGRAPHAVELARSLAAKAPLPLVLDADGLNAHAQMLPSLAGRQAPTVLTPHAGELGRLLGVDSSEVEARRLQHARDAAQLAQAVVVLKGDDTLVAEPGGTVAVSPGGSPGLATAGTGDVLSGVIGAFLAQGLDAFTAAAAGVLLHLIAGRIAAREVGCAEAVIASDVIAALPRARAEALGERAGGWIS